jgi:hypothetical protein
MKNHLHSSKHPKTFDFNWKFFLLMSLITLTWIGCGDPVPAPTDTPAGMNMAGNMVMTGGEPTGGETTGGETTGGETTGGETTGGDTTGGDTTGGDTTGGDTTGGETTGGETIGGMGGSEDPCATDPGSENCSCDVGDVMLCIASL